MDEKALVKKLEQEGFGNTYVWQDGPNASYPDHTHAEETAHIVLSGEMTLTMGGKTQTYRMGDPLRRACRRCTFGAHGTARLPVSDRRAADMIPVKRPLREEERALLDFLLSADFPGRDQLRAQGQVVTVAGECECGCGTIEFQVEASCAAARLEKPIPIEAYRDALDVLLFTREGFLEMLEIVFYADPPQRPYPRPEQLKLWYRPKNVTSS
jgi:hypothetical protein